jgi:hypothetical protein
MIKGGGHCYALLFVFSFFILYFLFFCITQELKKHIYEQHGLHKNLDPVVMNR